MTDKLELCSVSSVKGDYSCEIEIAKYAQWVLDTRNFMNKIYPVQRKVLKFSKFEVLCTVDGEGPRKCRKDNTLRLTLTFLFAVL